MPFHVIKEESTPSLQRTRRQSLRSFLLAAELDIVRRRFQNSVRLIASAARLLAIAFEVAAVVWLFVFILSVMTTGLSRPPGWHADPRMVFVPHENVFADAASRGAFAVILSSAGIGVASIIVAFLLPVLLRSRAWHLRLLIGAGVGVALTPVVVWLTLVPVMLTSRELLGVTAFAACW